LKCVVAAMYSWQHCGTGTLSYRHPRHLVTMDQWNGQQRDVAIKMFYIFGFFKRSPFLCHPVLTNCTVQEAKSPAKNFVNRRCAEGFNSGVKGLNRKDRVLNEIYYHLVVTLCINVSKRNYVYIFRV
jgi:hypothetical protein